MAGLMLKYAVDIKECAVRTHQKNHRKCKTLCCDVADFIAKKSIGEIVMHLIYSSNPCKYWSPQHTCVGKNDGANMAAAYTMEESAKKFRCRVMVFEQTPGLCAIERHRLHWQMFVRQFTSMGFDVEWRIINTAEYGNPQARRRLIIVASCPGQMLPDYPKPTHGPGLKPFVTVNEAIANISPRANMHNPDEQCRRHREKARKLPTADGNKPLHHLIDCCGPYALHPSGKRQFTVRETLRLQSFPDTYQYICKSRTEALEMAGDAVPPRFMKQVFEKCIEAMKQTDKEIVPYFSSDPILID